jgi:DNA-binding NarL/FixJ family response regulator
MFAALGIRPGEVEHVPKLRTGVRLTGRQREVAELLAHGLSNRDIARRLAVTQRTAESHVSAILEATGFTTRTQVSAWVTAGGLYRVPINGSPARSVRK